MTARTYGQWKPTRPRTLVVACSDGRLQEATDSFLEAELGLKEFDRLYVPGGGGGALSASDRDVFLAQQLRGECKYLVELHQVKQIILLFHGPARDGPDEAVCADYRRKLPWATPDVLSQGIETRELGPSADVFSLSLPVSGCPTMQRNLGGALRAVSLLWGVTSFAR